MDRDGVDTGRIMGGFSKTSLPQHQSILTCNQTFIYRSMVKPFASKDALFLTLNEDLY